MLEVELTTQFKRDVKLAEKRGKSMEKLKTIILKLVNQEELPARVRDHALKENYKGTRECHIEPDCLLYW